MSGISLRQTVTITNPQGLHMRPLSAFVKAAAQFQSLILVAKNPGEPINGKSFINLLTLAAEQGTVLTIEASGPDAPQALETLLEILRRPFDDE